MKTAIANLAVLLTARTSGFSKGMKAAQLDVDSFSRRMTTMSRIAKVGLGFVAMRGVVGTFRSIGRAAEDMGVKLGAVEAQGVRELTASFNGWRGATTELVLSIAGRLSPTLTDLIDRATALTIMLNKFLTPELLGQIVTISKWALTIYLSAKAISFLIVTITGLTKAYQWLTKAQIVQKAFSGPAGWAALAAGAAIAAATVWGVSMAFDSFEKSTAGALRAAGSEVDEFKRKVVDLQNTGRKLAVGVIGRDFQIGPGPTMGSLPGIINGGANGIPTQRLSEINNTLNKIYSEQVNTRCIR